MTSKSTSFLSGKRCWRVGTRGSALALAQVALVVDALRANDPGVVVHVEVLRTQGDDRTDEPLSAMRGQGIFSAEIEEALRRREIDFAVHSAKDLPSALPPDLTFAAILQRGDARDCLVARCNDVSSVDQLPAGSRIGTCSPRRNAQLLARYPELVVVDVRGNADTRLRKLDRGEFDALLLASAGLDRLGLSHRIAERFDTHDMVPSVGQGAIAVRCRSADKAALHAARCIDHADTRTTLSAERAFLSRLGAGCSAPAGAYAVLVGGELRIEAFLQRSTGECLRSGISGEADAAVSLGVALADHMISADTSLSRRTASNQVRTGPLNL